MSRGRAGSERADAAARRSISAWLLDAVATRPGAPAYETPAGTLTWSDVGRRVERIALGLQPLGVDAGDVVVVVAERSVEWFLVDFAVQTVGAITCGVHPTTTPADLDHVLTLTGATVVVAGGDGPVALVEAAFERLGGAGRRLVTIGPSGTGLSLADVERSGEARRPGASAAWRAAAAGWDPDRVVGLSFTSGTTGRPKGVAMTSRNLVHPNVTGIELQGGLRAGERVVNYAPSASHMERVFCMVLPLVHGVVAHVYGDDVDAAEAIRRTAPAVVVSSPRLLEPIVARLEPPDRPTRWALELRRRHIEAVWQGTAPSRLSAAAVAALDRLLLRRVRTRLGFGALRYLWLGGLPLAPETKLQWAAWGLRPVETYGMTETSGPVSMQVDRHPRPGDSGPIVPGAEVRIDGGELVVRGPGVFAGYWRDDAATTVVLDGDGWLRTGDIGTLDDGVVRLVDRRNALLRCADGRTVSCSAVETALKASDLVREGVIMLSADREHLLALIEVDRAWADRLGGADDLAAVAARPDVVATFGEVVGQTNRTLAEQRMPTIAAFRLLPKELDPGAGDEVTVTRKVKREPLARKFQHLVDEMEDELVCRTT